MLRLVFSAALFVLMASASANAQLEALFQPKPLATIPLPDWGTSVSFSPNGQTLAVGTYEKVLLIDVRSRKTDRELLVRGYARGLAWSPDGGRLATGGFQSVDLWNPATGDSVQRLRIRGYANDVAFTPDGTTLLAACEDGNVRRWNVADGMELEPLAGLKDPVQSVAISADGRFAAAAAGDETRLTRAGSVKVWTLTDGKAGAAIEVPPEKCATGVVFSPDAATLYVSDINKRVTLYDVATGQARSFFGKHSRQVNDVRLVRGGAVAVSAAGGQQKDGNEIIVWNTTDGEELAKTAFHTAKVGRVAVSPDESLLASVSIDKTAALWDFASMLKNAPASTPAAGANSANLPMQTVPVAYFADDATAQVMRVGIIGLDTSHATAFTKIINEAKDGPLNGFRVVAAPKGSPDILSSTERVPGYTEEVKKHGVEIVDSIETLLAKVDCVLLETNDGRPHLEQALPVLKAKKPVFIDKPVAGSLADAVAIYEAAKHYGTPVFSSSSLRYTKGAQDARSGALGAIFGCDAFSPAHLEETHPDLYWYGIHGVESLFTVMGTGCRSVSRSTSPDFDVAVGTWSDGRVGTFRGIRKGPGGYGGTIFAEKGVSQIGDYGGYAPLVMQIAEFFKTRKPPVTAEETLEIYAFMSAADVSKQKNGESVTLESVLTPAREAAKAALAGKLQ
jgi:hypothetical protein